MKGVIELSLRPYHGRLFIARSKKAYERAHQELFNEPDVLTTATAAKYSGGDGKDGMWTYLIWANKPHLMAHELSHVIMHVFDRCGMDVRDSGGEAFCYMLSQLMLETENA